MSLAKILFVQLLTLLFAMNAAWAVDPVPATPAGGDNTRKVAIYVKNRAKSVDDAKVTVLDDFVTTKISDAGFRVIGREDVANAVKSFAASGPNAGNNNLPGADLDERLSNNTSALQLTHNLGADFLLVLSITTYASTTETVDVAGVQAKVTTYTLACTYKVLTNTTGESITGDTVKVSKVKQEQPGNTQSGDPIDDLLEKASTKIADSLKAKLNNGAIAAAAPVANQPEFYVDCTTPDLEIPQVLKDETGQYKVQPNSCKLGVLSATVELDGVVVGVTPGPLSTTPGLHKIRISHEGFDDWTHTIGISDGKHLTVAMHMTDAQMARWRDNIRFLQDQINNSKLTDAQVKRIEGMAEMFKQSGFKVDVKSDVKIDKKVDAKITGTSLWPDQPAGKDGRDGRDGRDAPVKQ